MQLELLAEVVRALDSAGISHMVTGSFASTFHGEPRMTRDIDIVIDADVRSIQVFVARFEPGRFYIDDAESAVRRRDMFNVIETLSGWKVDLILLKDRPFSAEEFSRRLPARIGGVRTYVVSAEDAILSKLEWLKMSGSERQMRDVVSMLGVQGQALDNDYLDRWAQELGVSDQLRLAREASAHDID